MHFAGSDDAVAIVGSETTCTYAELERIGNGYSGLIGSYAGKGERVCLVCEPGPQAVQALTGIWRAGCVAVPLDPEAPDRRLEELVEMARPALLLTNRVLKTQVPSIPMSDLNSGAEQLRGSVPPIEADSLATLLFTSGSTGRPKGVLQTHANLHGLGRQFAETLSIEASDRVSCLFGTHFAASLLDIVTTFGCGATLCTHRLDAESLPRLWDWLVKNQITVLHTFPSILRVLLSQTRGESYLLKSLDLAGEPLTIDDVRQARTVFPEARIVNHLGLSELSVTSVFPVTSDFEKNPIPVGRPPSSTDILIEEEEILVTSPFLTPEYWDDPELNDSRFCLRDGVRYLRTGDRGRWDAKRRLEYLGREKSRVRIRGRNVDLVEVETFLRRHPGVIDCLVREEGGRLGAFYTCCGATPNSDELRSFLQRLLPSAHVPSTFQAVSALPRTATGKVQRLQPLKEKIEPRTTEEKILCGLLMRELGLSEIGVNESLQELGLDSLGASKVQHRLAVSGYQVQALEILEAHSVSSLAPSLTEKKEERLLDLFYDGGGTVTLMFFHSGAGIVRFRHSFCRKLSSVGPCFRMGPRRSLLPATLEEYASLFLEEVREVVREGRVWLVGYSLGGLLAYEVGRQLEAEGLRAEGLLLMDPILRKPTPWSVLKKEWKRQSWVTRLQYLVWGALRKVGEALAFLLIASGVKINLRIWQRVFFTHCRTRVQNYDPPQTSLRILLFESEEAVGDNVRRLAGGPLEVHRLRTNHEAVRKEPHLSRIVSVFDDVLKCAAVSEAEAF